MNSQTAGILTLCAALLSSTLLVALFVFTGSGIEAHPLSRLNRRVWALFAYLPVLIAILYWVLGLSLADDSRPTIGLILGAMFAGALIAALPLIMWRRAPKPR